MGRRGVPSRPTDLGRLRAARVVRVPSGGAGPRSSRTCATSSDSSYSTGGLHVAAFATGSVLAGLDRRAASSARSGGGRCSGARRRVMALGHGRADARARAGGDDRRAARRWARAAALLLITIQALLADHHGERRAVALTEANVAASVAYVVLIGALSLAAATGAGWRAALLASFAVPLLAVVAQPPRCRSQAPPQATRGRRPAAAAFRVAAAMLFCTTAAEWCITAWGASFVEEAADVSADTAVALMFGYFGGVVAGPRDRQPARAPPHRAPAAGGRAGGHRGRASRSCGRPRAPLQALARARRDRRSGSATCSRSASRSRSALAPDRAQLASGRAVLAGVARGAARAADGRRARRRDLADRGAGRRPGALALAARPDDRHPRAT